MACGRNNFAARENSWVGGWDQNKELVDIPRPCCHFGSSQLAAVTQSHLLASFPAHPTLGFPNPEVIYLRMLKKAVRWGSEQTFHTLVRTGGTTDYPP